MEPSRVAARTSTAAPKLTATRPAPRVLELQLAGTWRVGESIPSAAIVWREIDAERPDRLQFDMRAVVAWDSALVAFVTRVLTIARVARVTVERSGVVPGVQRLVALIEATPVERRLPKPRPSPLARVGLKVLARRDAAKQALVMAGELVIAFGRLVRGKAKFRRDEFWVHLQQTGPGALAIVGLVATLVGLIIAFISAVQLGAYGATLYVASLVGIAMVRDLGAVMAAIVVAGRTGAAFAAELGTMRVTQETNALTILGLSPVEFLVLPRVLAVTLMMPLLCVYADLLGVIGGAIVGIGLMDIAPQLYLDKTIRAISPSDLFGGIIKATTYGFLIGAAGCFTGLRSGQTAAGVGRAATSAVVAGIVLVIAACGMYSVVFYRLGI